MFLNRLGKHTILTDDGRSIQASRFDIKFMVTTNMLLVQFNETEEKISKGETFSLPINRIYFDHGFLCAQLEYFLKILIAEYAFLFERSTSLHASDKQNVYNLLDMWNRLFNSEETIKSLTEKISNSTDLYMEEHELKITEKVKDGK